MTCLNPACGRRVPLAKPKGHPGKFCGPGCREAFHQEARRLGARALLRTHHRRERAAPDPEKVAAIVAWAEARKPADPVAWGILWARRREANPLQEAAGRTG